MSTPGHFIDGRSAAFPGEAPIDVLAPHTGERIGAVPQGGEEAVAAAVASSARALGGWKDTPLAERLELMAALQARIEAGREELEAILVQEVGKPIRSARVEARNLVQSIEYFREQAPRRLTEPEPAEGGDGSLRILREAVGVVAAVTPFNFPVQLLGWKLCPAALSGCAVVCKPDPRTPLSTGLLARWAAEAGWPAGVFNVLHGDARTGAALVAHPRVDKVAFTGSVAAGRAVYRSAAEGIKGVTLELGGCSALIVCRDAELEGALGDIVNRSFYNSGQYCFRINRAYVHRERYGEFLDAFARAADKLVVGDPRDEHTDLGPLIDRPSLERALEQVARTERAGGRVVLDGRARCEAGGSYLGPTLIADVPADAAAMCEETFAPVVSVARFDELDQAIALANGTSYGLAAFALSGDAETSERLARELEAGSVWVNALDRSSMDAPFGGLKHSGLGVEKSRWAFDEYLQPRAIYIAGGR